MADDALTFHLEGKTYPIDDFEIGELEWLEDELGCSLDEVNFGSMKAVLRIIVLIKRRENPEFSMDEARKMKLSIFDEAEEDTGNGSRPTKARKGAKASSSGPRT